MERADGLDGEFAYLGQQGLDLCTVFSDDVEIIPASLAGPVIVIAAVETALGQRTELAEGVGAVQCAVGRVERHHDLRPMDHRGGEETQAVLSEFQHVTLLDGLRPSGHVDAIEELPEHLDGLGASHKYEAGIGSERPGYERGVIGLHMMYDKIVGFAAGKGLYEVGFPLLALAGVGGVHYGNLFVEDDIGVVGHAIRNYILAFKEVEVQVVDSDIFYTVVQGYGHGGWFWSGTNIRNSFEKWIWIAIFV